MKLSPKNAAVALLGAVALYACTGPAVEKDTGTEEVISQDSTRVLDSTFPTDASDLLDVFKDLHWDLTDLDATLSDLDVAGSDLDAVEADIPAACGGEDAPMGCPCQEPEDCQSGFCVLHLGNTVCSALCSGQCTEGWECSPGPSQEDGILLCLSETPSLCLPCLSDQDCAGEGEVCVRHGDMEGSFCGILCSALDECPESYTCQSQTTVDGLPVDVCHPEAGLCPCTSYAVLAQKASACRRSNESGTCSGERICTSEGLSPCDAPEPGEESCDGMDNNCNGSTDEGPLCDDGNPCTSNQCLGAEGCQNPPLDGACDDGDPCTLGDHCSGGTCLSGEPSEPCLESCGNGTCDPDETTCNCPGDCGLCQGCCAQQICVEGTENPSCGSGGEPCVACQPQELCVNGACLCQPSCANLQCGDDGCGGSCGVCALHNECQNGLCVEVPWCGDGTCAANESCFTCPADCGMCCGNGSCDAQYNENCLTCASDCPCTECGNQCVAGTCQYTACQGRECGDDGCGTSCGTCAEHKACQDGTCVDAPWCGDGDCNGSESCFSCPADCQACCGNLTCDDEFGETCSNCESDCGICCGNGFCEPEFGEDCDLCGVDCACLGCGELCVAGSCHFVNCQGRECGEDGCGGSCGDCAEHEACVEGACAYVPWCGDGACDPDEDCISCEPDCGPCCGNGLCQEELGENCESCVSDCACPSCGQECVQANCLFTACDGRQCGDDGCQGSCGDCGEHEACQDGTCVPVSWCGNGVCDADEDCHTCQQDCGTCCGNGVCEPLFDENCQYCPTDCACGCGEVCLNLECVFTACNNKECGSSGCGTSCGTCPLHHLCQSNQCVFIPYCGDGDCSPSRGETCLSCATDCGDCCGNGACEATYGEDCSTCAMDCTCDCGESCVDSTCQYTACNLKECGSDGCGGSCGDCPAYHECLTGICRYSPSCGDDYCNELESCSTCPADCGACCGNGSCQASLGETCSTCPADCGACCGNGSCQASTGETCSTCPADCGCDCGEQCQSGACVFTACDGKDCGMDGCGGTCGTCATHYECQGTTCVFIPYCWDGVCDDSEDCSSCPADCGNCCGNGECQPGEGENCLTCPADCGCNCGEQCQLGACVFTACNGKDCGDDGCGSVCGTCATHYECQGSTCVYIPYCWDGNCDVNEDCSSCPADCGNCCGNGECQTALGENCLTCGLDCPCGCGEQCQSGACVFTACSDKDCGADGCGGTCGTCPAHYECQGNNCIYVPYCSDGACDAGETCASCPADCGDCCGNGECQGSVGENCLTCPSDCTCGCGEQCLSGTCTFTACEGKNCGPDGCGGLCGTCSTGQTCDAGLCKTSSEPGTLCASPDDCASQLCIDGVCCQSVCDGLCESCAIQGQEGSCQPYPDQTDPEGECDPCMACNGEGVCTAIAKGQDPKEDCEEEASCGDNGTCNGTGACDLWGTERECGASLCLEAVWTLPDHCDGLGNCVDGGIQNCAPYACSGNACADTCTLDSDCTTDAYCQETMCVPQKALAGYCEGDNECLSGFCADGTCCETACAGTCQVCNRVGLEGVCSFIPLATDPEDECGLCQTCDGAGACTNVSQGLDPLDDCSTQAPCGFDGNCDGTGSCRLWSDQTVCVQPTCQGFTLTLASNCDGEGLCNTPATQDCTPYLCGATQCRTSCTSSADCVPGAFCNGTVCEGKQALGTPCEDSDQCSSGFCSDGVCCNTECSGLCRRCNAPASTGTCADIPANTDPEGECPVCSVCLSGACQFVSAGLDPVEDCSQSDPNTCGDDGTCDGSGSCRQWESNTACSIESCTGTTHTLGDTCDGTGTCVDGGTESCCPYRCGGQGCLEGCATADQCCSGNYCEGSECVTLKTDGAYCSAGNECVSGHCVDGVCCNSDCTGTCQACNLAGTPGTCSYVAANLDPGDDCGLCQACDGGGACTLVPAGDDPLNECPEAPQSTCGTDGLCDGEGGCRLWGDSATCQESSCTGSTLQPAGTCDSLGNCSSPSTSSCCPYLCSGKDCATTCTKDSECCAGNFCQAGVCVTLLGTGADCEASSQCQSQFCVDGVCCTSGCLADCMSCNLPGTVGTCSPDPLESDPQGDCGTCRMCDGTGNCMNVGEGNDPLGACPQEEPCGMDGTCDGAGSCRFWGEMAVCRAQSCTDALWHAPDTCDGAGNCPDSGTVSCNPYQCDGEACATSCSTDAECVAGYYCAGGQCLPVLTLGAPCADAADCQSGYCVDGVCCIDACDAPCKTCASSGYPGYCMSSAAGQDPDSDCGFCRSCNGLGACIETPAGTDPKGDCEASLPTSCGYSGQCDGAGSCDYWSETTPCGTATCVTSTYTPAPLCNAAGTCVPQTGGSCCPYLCSGNACGTSCNSDSLCCESAFCSGVSCLPRRTPGAACDRDRQCASGFCRDGVCCTSDCAGDCQSCNLAGSAGTCSPYASGLDPENDCPLCQMCGGGTACVNQPLGTDLFEECSASAASTCGLNGSCDGLGGCAKWNANTVCVAESCSGQTFFPNDLCDGNGTCLNTASTSCCPYLCSGSTCSSFCVSDAGCCDGNYCLNSSCVPRNANGTACTNARECSSGYCVDGVCCNTDCTGTCRKCNLGTSVGTCSDIPSSTDPDLECGLCQFCDGAAGCTPIPDGQDPLNQCHVNPSLPCGSDGQCDGAGACRLRSSDTVCNYSSVCSGGVLDPIDYCDGSGNCIDSPSHSCEPYVCAADGSECRVWCSEDVDCATGSFCQNLQCVGWSDVGESCWVDSQCISGYCVDGVCCESECNGLCETCSQSGAWGECLPITAGLDPAKECPLCEVCDGAGACQAVQAGTDPKNNCAATIRTTCGLDGMCDGSGACRFWDTSTVCVTASCLDSVTHLADHCSGNGVCVDYGIQECDPWGCDATATQCRDTCGTDADCAPGRFCVISTATCVGSVPDGEPCSQDDDCDSTHCVDGVCCNTECTGICQSCDLTGFVGVCTSHALNTDEDAECGSCDICNGAGACMPVAVNTDPKEDCVTTEPDTCNYNGICDGTGSCDFWETDVQCASSVCLGETYYYDAYCNGAGACPAQETLDCRPYSCNGDVACRDSCTQDSECCSTGYCDAGVCKFKQFLGTPCTEVRQCLSGICSDGVCCNLDCTGTCETCVKAGEEGLCRNYDPNTDPELECGFCGSCGGYSSCGHSFPGTDPKSECSPTPQSTCGLDGQCDGRGACEYWSATTVCVTDYCSGITQHYKDFCSGYGVCLDSGYIGCSPYICQEGTAVCRSNCSLDTHCITNYYCSSSSTCLSKKSNGSSCTGSNQCLSGQCVDGVCCNTSCTSLCRACNVTGSKGTCTYVPAGTDPASECAGTTVCNGAGSCVAP